MLRVLRMLCALLVEMSCEEFFRLTHCRLTLPPIPSDLPPRLPNWHRVWGWWVVVCVGIGTTLTFDRGNGGSASPVVGVGAMVSRLLIAYSLSPTPVVRGLSPCVWLVSVHHRWLCWLSLLLLVLLHIGGDALLMLQVQQGNGLSSASDCCADGWESVLFLPNRFCKGACLTSLCYLLFLLLCLDRLDTFFSK